MALSKRIFSNTAKLLKLLFFLLAVDSSGVLADVKLGQETSDEEGGIDLGMIGTPLGQCRDISEELDSRLVRSLLGEALQSRSPPEFFPGQLSSDLIVQKCDPIIVISLSFPITSFGRTHYYFVPQTEFFGALGGASKLKNFSELSF